MHKNTFSFSSLLSKLHYSKAEVNYICFNKKLFVHFSQIIVLRSFPERSSFANLFDLTSLQNVPVSTSITQDQTSGVWWQNNRIWLPLTGKLL
jgi:hypothetical protein